MGPNDEIMPLTSGFVSLKDAAAPKTTRATRRWCHEAQQHYLRHRSTVPTAAVTCGNALTMIACDAAFTSVNSWFRALGMELVFPTRVSYEHGTRQNAGQGSFGLQPCTVVSSANELVGQIFLEQYALRWEDPQDAPTGWTAMAAPETI